MNIHNIHTTYEKMYAYEEEIKNSISIKTQIIFTAIFALASATIYLARFLDFTFNPKIAYVISFFIATTLVISAISTYFNCKAFSGSEFNRMPYAEKIKEYYESQIEYNDELAKYNVQVAQHEQIPLINPAKETASFISNTYISCSTHNALVNEERSRWVFKALSTFLMACIPLAIGSLLFVLFDMDTSSPRKNFAIKDTYVGDQIAALKTQLLNDSKSDAVADLKKRTIILENIVLEKGAEKLSEPNKPALSEHKTLPQAPVKPSAPPSRKTYDDVNGGPNRNQK
ncbi:MULTISPECIES: hypothetical protein [unclassified Pseudomonas]|uniref:hypothetical protein n=1 Tax=unclassified Pseudomonas TaxID=196821 RepID=UPI00200E7E3C|nr:MULTISPECIES: hypothetical protein [unclassified Pseudomonas]